MPAVRDVNFPESQCGLELKWVPVKTHPAFKKRSFSCLRGHVVIGHGGMASH